MTLLENAKSTRARTHRGCALAYCVAGEGPPVLFIQGTAIHGDGFMPQLEELARDHACLWFDNRGMSRSQPLGDGRLTVAQMAEDARILLDEVGWPSAHVVGHSLGGVIALELALSARERVRSLALLCTSACGAELTRLDASMLWRALRMELGSMRSRRRAFLEIVLAPGERPGADLDQIAAELEPIFGHDIAVRPPVALKQVRAMGRWDVRSRLTELAGLPALVLGASHDIIARPEIVRALAAAYPGARLVEIDGAAHGVTVTRAAEVNGYLREHLAAAERGPKLRSA